jgi:hypothetical protein
MKGKVMREMKGRMGEKEHHFARIFSGFPARPSF